MEKEELLFAENLKKDYPLGFKRWIARAIESKELSIRQAKEKYLLAVEDRTIFGWVERYGVAKELSLATMTPEEKQEKALLEKRIKALEKAQEAVNKAIDLYNNRRPHASCDYMTPALAHDQNGSLHKRWKKPKWSREVQQEKLVN